MNNSYFNPAVPSNIGSSGPPEFGTNFSQGTLNELPMEQSYVENILRMNIGKVASFYMTFTDSNEWRDRVFTGVVEQAARDHVVISDPKTGKWYLLLSIYLDFIVFDEEINYKIV